VEQKDAEMNLDINPWEEQFLKHLPNADTLAWTDRRAISMYPDWMDLYDRLYVSQQTNHPGIDLELEFPDVYPVFVKPRVSLDSCGEGSEVIYREEDLPKVAGMMAQAMLSGDHLTTDYIVKDGKVIDFFTFMGHKNTKGSFTMFEAVDDYNDDSKALVESFDIRDGVVNVESIGKTPIEMHLRPSLQFYDISSGLMVKLPDFIRTGDWKRTKFKKAYSKVYRRSEDATVVFDMEMPAIPVAQSGVSSVQFWWNMGKPLSDEPQDGNSFRYMCVNGDDIMAILDYGDLVKDCLGFQDILSAEKMAYSKDSN
jgi:hypothetical protein